MKLQQLYEMGAASVCPKCGQGPMSKTHYWYKGGWQCKSAPAAAPAPRQLPASGNTPATTVVGQSRLAPSAPPAMPSAAPQQPVPKATAPAAAPGQFPAASLRKQMELFLQKLGVKGFSINPDMSVDVNGDVRVTTSPFTRIPCKFKKVSGSFVWSAGKLISLENAPDEVGGDFDVHANQIKSLEHMPTSVGGMVSLSGNKIESWVGLSSLTCNDDLSIQGNPATDIVENLPPTVKGDLTLGSPQPWSLRGIHKKTKVEGEIILTGNIAEGGLGLMMMKGLKMIDASHLSDKEAERAFAQIDKARENKDDVLDTQEKLIDAGLAKFAKL